MGIADYKKCTALTRKKKPEPVDKRLFMVKVLFILCLIPTLLYVAVLLLNAIASFIYLFWNWNSELSSVAAFVGVILVGILVAIAFAAIVLKNHKKGAFKKG